MMNNKDNLLEWVNTEFSELEKGLENDSDLEYFRRAITVYCSALVTFEGDGSKESLILKRLLDGDPLCSLTDEEKWWMPLDGSQDLSYHIRRPSLTRKLEEDGSYFYLDNKRVECIDQNDPMHPYTNGVIEYILVNQISPIKFPYMPVGKFKVYTERFLYDEKNKEYGHDTLMITYVRTPAYRMLRIYKYYKISEDGWIEIYEWEYAERKTSACKTS